MAASKNKRKKKDALAPRPVTIKGHSYWQVHLPSQLKRTEDGTLVRIRPTKTFADLGEAKTFADQMRVQKLNYGAAALAISDTLRTQAVAAETMLRPYGVTILEVVREYVQRAETLKKSQPIKIAVTEFIAGAIHDGRSARYVADLRSRLRRFARDFAGRRLAEISTGEIENWLRSLHVSGVSRNSYRRRLYSMFECGAARSWCAFNPVGRVAIAKERPGPIGILEPSQLARLLDVASSETLPYWAIGAFAGLRSAELERLEWRDVHFAENLIEIEAAKSKTASRRFIRIRPNLAEWLAPYKNARGPIAPLNLRKRLEEDRRQAGITQWPANALRHSFASYLLAAEGDAGRLALELGHSSPGIVFAHYRELVKPTAAAQYWSITPQPAATVKLAAIA
jgi:integrase